MDAGDVLLATTLFVLLLLLLRHRIRLLPSAFQRAAVAGAWAHLLGAAARYVTNAFIYKSGDSFRYFNTGHAFADAFWRDGLRAFDVDGPLWGTQFVDRVSGALQLFFGSNFLAESVIFAAASYAGTLLLAISAARAFPTGRSWVRLTWLILVWPSLCFWPSTIGKEALILLSLGMLTFGWVGNGSTPRLGWVFAGLVLAGLIRPHIAMMFALCLGSAEWLAPTRRLNSRRVLRGVALLALSVVAVRVSLDQLGVDANLEAMSAFAVDRSGRTQTGGSQIGVVSGPLVVPMAFVNVMMRPFVWEVGNPAMLLSAIEVLLMWALLWKNRHGGWRLLTVWRESRLLLFAVPATFVLTLFYGAFVSNLGILARQRVVILPLLFMFVEIAPLMFRQRLLAPSGPRQNSRVRAVAQ